MTIRRLALGLVLACLAGPGMAFAQASDTRYLVPPEDIVRILDAPPPPMVMVSPSRDTVAIVERASMPPIAELAQPMLRLAGIRLNPATNGPHRTPGITAITFKAIAGGVERRVTLEGSSLMPIGFSPDGKRFALGNVVADGITLSLVDPASGAVRPVPGVTLNAMFVGMFGGGEPCDWTDDSSTLVCRTVPAGRGPAPAPPPAPSGPEIQETSGKAAPIRTYQDLLTSAHDEALFEHYGSAQVVAVDAAT
ncbi:MAG: hypothetical protein MUF60_04120, partial [Vicinamibacterales bacterium]|nr:hypothetical protein [Vicinamibacterales bacterium]